MISKKTHKTVIRLARTAFIVALVSLALLLFSLLGLHYSNFMNLFFISLLGISFIVGFVLILLGTITANRIGKDDLTEK